MFIIIVAALTVAEAEASEAKVEYDIVLRESRDPDFIEMYGASKVVDELVIC